MSTIVTDARGAIHHAPGKDDVLELPAHGVLIGLHRRRGGPKHHQGAGALSAHDRNVAAVVARALLLLVRRVVLLVDHDQTELRDRREDRRPRPHHDVHLAAANALPLIVTFAVRQPAMLDRDAIAKGFPKRGGDCWRQGNFRHEHNRAATGRALKGRQPQVKFRFSAAGDAVKQGGAKRAGAGEPGKALERRLLIGR